MILVGHIGLEGNKAIRIDVCDTLLSLAVAGPAFPFREPSRMSKGRGFLIAFHEAVRCCFKGGECNYSSDAPSRREDRYCVGDIPKEALNNRLKWAESLKPHL